MRIPEPPLSLFPRSTDLNGGLYSHGSKKSYIYTLWGTKVFKLKEFFKVRIAETKISLLW